MVLPEQPVADQGPREGRLGQRLATAALALGLLALGLFTLRNFLAALVWAGILAIALWPLYRRTASRLPGRLRGAVLPGLFTLAVALVFIAPIGLIGLQLARETHAAAEWAQGVEANGLPEPEFLHHLPFGQERLDAWWQQNLADPGSAKTLVQRMTQGQLSGMGRDLGVQLVRRLTLFGFTLLTLFFLFREGHALADQMRRAASRAFGTHGERLGGQIIASVHGTVNGLVLVGLGVGVVLGIVYAVAGVPHPTILGAITAVAAMIPFAAFLAYGLAALLLVGKGSVAWGIAVFGIGALVTFLADHLVRPVLIGGTTRLPFLWVLLGILGGIETWGLLGLFLGPAIMAALIMLWRDYFDVRE